MIKAEEKKLNMGEATQTEEFILNVIEMLFNQEEKAYNDFKDCKVEDLRVYTHHDFEMNMILNKLGNLAIQSKMVDLYSYIVDKRIKILNKRNGEVKNG